MPPAPEPDAAPAAVNAVIGLIVFGVIGLVAMVGGVYGILVGTTTGRVFVVVGGHLAATTVGEALVAVGFAVEIVVFRAFLQRLEKAGAAKNLAQK